MRTLGCYHGGMLDRWEWHRAVDYLTYNEAVIVFKILRPENSKKLDELIEGIKWQ